MQLPAGSVEGEDSDTTAEVTLLETSRTISASATASASWFPTGMLLMATIAVGLRYFDRERLCTLGQGWKEHFPEELAGKLQLSAGTVRLGETVRLAYYAQSECGP
jgi:hypothetical protein